MPISRPQPDEYADYYAGYINRVPEGDLFEILAQQIQPLRSLLSNLSDEQANFRYTPDAWSIKEVVGHVCDGERVFAYRAFNFSRNDQNTLPGFDQNDFVIEANFDSRPLTDLLDEFELLRRANVLTFKHISDEASRRRGTASNNPISVRALLYILAGHVLHHIEDLKKDYLHHL